MYRKHTRRAAKASFAVSLGVALLIGLVASVGAGASPAAKPTVVIGSKNFTEQFILGQLYKQALEAKGYKVKYSENIGSSELIDTALKSGKINFYPEYTGVIVADLAHQTPPKTAAANYAAAKKFEESRGNTLFAQTPFYDSDSFGMLTSTAKKYGVKTIGDMKKVKSFSYAGFPECKTRNTCFVGYTKQYGITNATFTPLAGISAYAALDNGSILAADVFSTDPPLGKGSKYTVLADPKHVTGFQNVAPIVKTSVVTSLGSKFTTTVNAVSAKLTQNAIVAMNKAVIVDKQSAASVASAFLKANGLK